MLAAGAFCAIVFASVTWADEPSSATTLQPPLDIALTKRMLRVLPQSVDAVILTGPLKFQQWPQKPIGYGLDGKLRYARVPPAGVSFDEYAFESCNSLFEFQLQLQEACRTTPVEFTITAFQRGTSEQQPLELSQIIVFKSSIPPAGRQLLAKSTRAVAGIPVMEVVEVRKNPHPSAPSSIPPPKVATDPRAPAPAPPIPPKYWYASPTERVLVAATSEKLMTDLLQAFSVPRPVDNDWAIPKLVEQLKTNTWACRKFDPANLAHPPAGATDPNAKASQVILAYDRPKRAMIVQTVSADPESAVPVKKLVEGWSQFGKVTAVQQLNPNSAQLVVSEIDHAFWMAFYLIGTYDGASIPI